MPWTRRLALTAKVAALRNAIGFFVPQAQIPTEVVARQFLAPAPRLRPFKAACGRGVARPQSPERSSASPGDRLRIVSSRSVRAKAPSSDGPARPGRTICLNLCSQEVTWRTPVRRLWGLRPPLWKTRSTCCAQRSRRPWPWCLWAEPRRRTRRRKTRRFRQRLREMRTEMCGQGLEHLMRLARAKSLQQMTFRATRTILAPPIACLLPWLLGPPRISRPWAFQA
mmetsp:Transcript_1694/g.3172  ORF Transcript_1694/g.3172 Transcript_1694/m.3172 type:complete len:225 (+) Transcript_1694:491-1165(+)